MIQRGAKLSEAQQHYVEKDDYKRFIYYQKSTSVTERILAVMYDAEKLIGQCGAGGYFDGTSEYQLLIRLLKERTIIDEDGFRRIRGKEEVEEPSKVLLTPSNPEATFRYKAGCKHLLLYHIQ